MATRRKATALALFPLPNVVLFPDADLKLHIFEPRYRRLVRDLLDRDPSDRRIGMVLLKPGWRDGDPDVFAAGTAGRLIDFEPLPDGRSNIVLRGEYRFAIEREVDAPELPYRKALVTRLGEQAMEEDEADALRRALLDQALRLSSEMGQFLPWPLEDLEELRGEASLQAVVHRLAQELDIPALRKLRLLAEELEERSTSVLRILRSRQRVLDLLRPFRRLADGAAHN